jgi:hypothetical protein
VVTVDELRASLAHPEPPSGLAPLARAMWLDGRGDWNGAHNIAQNDDSRPAAWVHAYLHRKEGDTSNAAYWYRRAGRAPFAQSLEEEWAAIVRSLLDDPPKVAESS